MKKLALVVDPSAFITPSNLWSLWVPISLLVLILLAAIYFVRLNIR